MTRSILAVLAALPIALGACRSPERQLVDTRRELRATLDGLYAEYSGRGERPPEGADAGVLGHLAGQMDRAWFEAQCIAVGRGERGLSLSARLEAFLSEDRNARACRKAADLQLEADELERKVAAERR
jgi:hypothetical protein